VRQNEIEQLLLAQQQARLDNEREILVETEMRVKSEMQACADSEERKVLMQRARASAQAKAELAQEEARIARQFAELEECGNARLDSQLTRSRTEMMIFRLMTGMSRVMQFGRLGKSAGVISAALLIGISLRFVAMQPEADAKLLSRAGMTNADRIVTEAAQRGLKPETLRPATNRGLENLKLSDHLGE
jgi:hypothetical protein